MLFNGGFRLRIDAILSLALIAWFMSLATAELISARKRQDAEPVGNARLITNFGLGISIMLVSGFQPLAKVGSSMIGRAFGLGLAGEFALPWIVMLAVLLIVESFASYWTHRAMHALPPLWRIHRVHHADSAVDVSTSLRHHPLELAVTLPVSALIILAIGAPVSAVVASQTIMTAASIFQHADIGFPRRERALGKWLVTPEIHRLHHSPEQQLHDGNYGDLIILWDRLFGTFNRSAGRVRVGLDDQLSRPDDLLEQILSPVRAG